MYLNEWQLALYTGDKEKLEELLTNLRVAVEPYVGKLAGMGSPPEIREFLAAEGVKGICKAGTNCAIANYIRERSGQDVHVSGVGIRSRYTLDKEFEVTDPMRTFIVEFDEGLYPELVA